MSALLIAQNGISPLEMLVFLRFSRVLNYYYYTGHARGGGQGLMCHYRSTQGDILDGWAGGRLGWVGRLSDMDIKIQKFIYIHKAGHTCFILSFLRWTSIHNKPPFWILRSTSTTKMT